MSGLPLLATSVTIYDWVMVFVVVVLLAVSALLALSETSLVRMTKAKALVLADEKRLGARQLVRLVDDPATFLNAVLLLVLVSQVVVATFVGILAEHFFGGWGVLVGIVFEVAIIFVLAEALPKNWAVQNPERSALLVAPLVTMVVGLPPIRWISGALIGLAERLMGPGGAGGVSESELLAMADVAVADRAIETEERKLIHSILEFGDTVVREVMVPRPDMRTVDADLSVSEALEVAMAAGFSRLPAHSGNFDDVVGIAYVKDLVACERTGCGDEAVSEHVRPAQFVPETKRVSQLMREMQELTYHLAIVVDEYGGTAGLVTLEDLIEELVGEIVDEFDVEEPALLAMAGGAVSVSARLSVDELNEQIGAELPTGNWDTVGGLVFGILGKVPVEGESVEVGGYHLVAQRVQGNRIGRVRVVPVGDTRPTTSLANHPRPSTHEPDDHQAEGAREPGGRPDSGERRAGENAPGPR